MRSEDVSTFSLATRGLLPAIRALLRSGGYLVLWWDDGRPYVARAGHASSLEGCVVTEFVPFKPYRGIAGMVRALWFKGYVRTRVLKGAPDAGTR